MAKKTLEAEIPDVLQDDAVPEVIEEEDKKSKKKREKKEKQKKKKGGFPVVPVLILLVIIGAIASVLVLNLFNIREQYIMPYLRNAPLIGQYFPAEEVASADEAVNRYATMTPEEISAEVTALESQIERLTGELQAAKDQNATDSETITYLRGFESQIEAYREVKAQFDEMVVTGANPEDYIAFFETISPENAERLAEMAQEKSNYNSEASKLSASYAAMNAQAAADSLVLMLTTRPEQLVAILKNMSPDDQAKIFDKIPADQMSQITNLLFPVEPTEIPAATAPPLQQ